MLKIPVNGLPIITRGYIPRVHLGTDYAVEHRTAIISTAGGVVLKVNDTEKRNWLANTPSDPFKKGLGKVIYYRSLTTADYGKYVKINHGKGIATLYAHLDEVLVYEGQSVVEGQLIGYSDNTGNSTGNHLHFEIRKDDIVIDPSTFDFNFNGEEVSNTQVNEIKDKVKITVPTLYVRSGPSRTYPLSGSKELHRNVLVDVVGFTEGEEIDSNKLWYKSAKGNYFWSGGTDKPYPVISESKNMTREENDAKKVDFEARAVSIEARRAELENAVAANAADKAAYDADYASFIAEPVDESIEEVVAEPVVETVETVVAEEVVAETPVDKIQDEKISKLEALYEELKGLLGK